MALDEAHQRLFVGCRSGAVVVFDSNTGRELTTLPITKGIDDMEFDTVSKAIGGGMVDVLNRRTPIITNSWLRSPRVDRRKPAVWFRN
jgi:hypothetical protein